MCRRVALDYTVVRCTGTYISNFRACLPYPWDRSFYRFRLFCFYIFLPQCHNNQRVINN